MTFNESVQLITAIGFGGFISTLFTLYINTSNSRQTMQFNEKKDAYIRFLDAYQFLELSGFKDVEGPVARYRDMLSAVDRIAIVGSPLAVKLVARITRLAHESLGPGSEETKSQLLDQLGTAYNDLRNEIRRDLGIDPAPIE